MVRKWRDGLLITFTQSRGEGGGRGGAARARPLLTENSRGNSLFAGDESHPASTRETIRGHFFERRRYLVEEFNRATGRMNGNT